MTHNNDTQNQRQISAQIERTAHNRSSLFEWSIPPYNPKQWNTHDADQRQILKVLSL